MRWLIVEDALKNRQGHWLEWVTTFDRGFRELGDEVTVLADAEVEPDIRDLSKAEPILPRSIWHRIADGSGPATRYSRVFIHAWQTWRAMSRYLRSGPDFDAIFVPTVSVHHLLAWARLIKTVLRRRKSRALLFFLTAPMKVDSAGIAVSDGSPTARLLVGLLRGMALEVRSGKVVLGVETKRLQDAMEKLTGLPFVWFPQPVAAPVRETKTRGERIEMACFGAARAEKGSDVLQEAIGQYLHERPTSRARFTIQWIDDFQAEGRLVTKLAELQANPRVRFVTGYFRNGEYGEWLRSTDVMLLPYRRSSYGLRGSRVVIEAAVNGIPVVATRGTTLASVAEEFGSGVWCEDGDARSLTGAISEMELRFEEMSGRAVAARASAVAIFSVVEFRRLFIASAKAEFAVETNSIVQHGARGIAPKFSHES